MISRIFLSIPVLFFLLSFSAAAMDEAEFDRIYHLDMAGLTKESRALLDRKYPGEDWGKHRFPRYVYSSEAVETGYRIAVKEPELLRSIPCYCFCDVMGHENLLNCFLRDGRGRGTYDEHAVTCNICFGQAMLAFLWSEGGASEERIRGGMERRFEHLASSAGE
jgi:hypothetical protein